MHVSMYFLHLSNYVMVSGLIPEMFHISPSQLERFAYVADLYLSFGLNVMIVGSQGTGKSSFVQVGV